MNVAWFDLLSFLLIFTFAIVSPGPNFIMVVNASLSASRKTALLTALGVAVGSGLFATAGMLGLMVLVRTLPYFDDIAPLVGGGYLVWLGIKMVRYRVGVRGEQVPRAHPVGRSFSAFRAGLLTNLTNPKAWAFYLSLFTLVLSPQASGWLKTLLVALMFLISLGWYATVVVIMSQVHFRAFFDRFQNVIQGVLGLLLIGFGLRLLMGR